MMEHIPTTRLLDLSGEVAIRNADEVQHLWQCEECDELLRIFVHQYRITREMLKEQANPSAVSLLKRAA